MLNVCVSSWKDFALVAVVLPAHSKRRRAVIAERFEDLGVSVGLPEWVTADDQSVARTRPETVFAFSCFVRHSVASLSGALHVKAGGRCQGQHRRVLGSDVRRNTDWEERPLADCTCLSRGSAFSTFHCGRGTAQPSNRFRLE